VVPVANALHQWLDRIQEFRTHVFPHCFLPNVEEYFQFLTYLHFDRHIRTQNSMALSEQNSEGTPGQLEASEEFQILLAATQSGKELGIVKDAGKNETI
jgi:hypothetical protein